MRNERFLRPQDAFLFAPDGGRSSTPAYVIDDIHRRMDSLVGLTGEELRAVNLEARVFFDAFKKCLTNGDIRAAEKGEDGVWQVNPWVKQGILIGMRLGNIVAMSGEDESLQFFDKDTYPIRSTDGIAQNIRIVPGGSSIRDGAYIGKGVIMMPPSYVNVGAYVGEGTMIDSHALVGSCAQVGENCHISGKIGGVLEPVNANPCIVEDRVVMFMNSSISEGVILEDGVVLAPGVNITSSTKVYDYEKEEVYTSEDGPLTVPENAVVVPGNKILGGEFARRHGLGIYVPVIRKYRGPSTDAKTALEEALR